MQQKAVIMDENSISRAVARICYEIIERNKGVENVCVIGIYSRGIHLAERIAEKLSELEGTRVPYGGLDITAYRDDERRGSEDKTDIPFSITGKTVIIADDVIFTGRSSRAAIDAIMSRGRPGAIQLAVLIDRGHRELPIRPDYIGKNVPTGKNESIRVMLSESDGCDKALIYEAEENK